MSRYRALAVTHKRIRLCQRKQAQGAKEELVKEGYRMRVYLPFGSQWYPYLMRRLAERPANIAFILGNVVKEGMRRP